MSTATKPKKTRTHRDPVEVAIIVCRRRLLSVPRDRARAIARYLYEEFSQLEIPGATLSPQVGDIAAPGAMPWKPTVGPT